MQRTLVALGCCLTLAIGSAFAQQQNPKSTKDSAGPTMTEKAKDAAQTIGEKAKEAVDKVKDMAQDAADKSKAGADERKAESGDSGPSSKTRQMQAQADADFKAAKAKCDPIDSRVQKTVCEKQAAVAHANAELRIAKANAAAATGKTSTMGAGKAAR